MYLLQYKKKRKQKNPENLMVAFANNSEEINRRSKYAVALLTEGIVENNQQITAEFLNAYDFVTL